MLKDRMEEIMEILVDSRQMKQCDKNTIEHFGVPSLLLMERAALSVVEEIDLYFSQKCKQTEKKVLLVCGCGNNGGDGLAIARILWQRGYKITIVMPKESRKLSLEAKTQIEILYRYGISMEDTIPEKEFDVIVDALFGVGLTRNLEGINKEYITCINKMRGLKIAVDIPSGIHADTGEVMGVGFYADITITFAFAKLGLLLYPGTEYAGKVLVKEIGIDRHSFLEEKPMLYCLEKSDFINLPVRKDYSNKGSYGKVLTIAGHKNMAGAAFLSGKASYVVGSGMVRIFTEETNRIILQQSLPEAILTTYEKEIKQEVLKDLLLKALNWATVVVVGPGLGLGETAEFLVRTTLEYAKIPVILDADGLNLITEHLEWLKTAEAPIIVTPHLGEMARLIKKSIIDIQKQLLQVAQNFSKEYNVTCILKDARSITAWPNGITFINTSGNNGMATAGAGDVLTGILAGLIAQGMEVEKAAPMGVYLHGVAADKQMEEVGTYGMMAQDIIKGISKVLKSI